VPLEERIDVVGIAIARNYPVPIDWKKPTIYHTAAAPFERPTKLFCVVIGTAFPGERSSIFKIVFHIYVSFLSLA
jgi:hypothetical protein